MKIRGKPSCTGTCTIKAPKKYFKCKNVEIFQLDDGDAKHYTFPSHFTVLRKVKRYILFNLNRIGKKKIKKNM